MAEITSGYDPDYDSEEIYADEQLFEEGLVTTRP